MLRTDFELLKSQQYCDFYGQIGQGNLRTHSTKSGQIQCNLCNSKLFSVRKGTMFFDLRTTITKVISELGLLASGIGVNE